MTFLIRIEVEVHQVVVDHLITIVVVIEITISHEAENEAATVPIIHHHVITINAADHHHHMVPDHVTVMAAVDHVAGIVAGVAVVEAVTTHIGVDITAVVNKVITTPATTVIKTIETAKPEITSKAHPNPNSNSQEMKPEEKELIYKKKNSFQVKSISSRAPIVLTHKLFRRSSS